MARLVDRTARLTVGYPTTPRTDVDPVISENARDRVLRHVGEGMAEGANLAIGGRAIQPDDAPDGYFVEPTVFTGVNSRMRVARQEISGQFKW